MKFAFVAKPRPVRPASWICEAPGVSRSGVPAWRSRPASAPAIAGDRLPAETAKSFQGSGRAYGARRAGRDVLAEGFVPWSASRRTADASERTASRAQAARAAQG